MSVINEYRYNLRPTISGNGYLIIKAQIVDVHDRPNGLT